MSLSWFGILSIYFLFYFEGSLLLCLFLLYTSSVCFPLVVITLMCVHLCLALLFLCQFVVTQCAFLLPSAVRPVFFGLCLCIWIFASSPIRSVCLVFCRLTGYIPIPSAFPSLGTFAVSPKETTWEETRKWFKRNEMSFSLTWWQVTSASHDCSSWSQVDQLGLNLLNACTTSTTCYY